MLICRVNRVLKIGDQTTGEMVCGVPVRAETAGEEMDGLSTREMEDLAAFRKGRRDQEKESTQHTSRKTYGPTVRNK